MKIFTSNFNIILLILALCMCISMHAQSDSLFQKKIPADTLMSGLNMDAVYDRPFLKTEKIPIAIGGYVEANTQYASTDGVSDGFSFQAKRITLFFSSTIAKKLKFLAELEFEDGTKEINLEFAAMDIELHPLLNVRGGILMNPIGSFNQNHDGPKWDFVDRPISSTTLIPSTLSNVGGGLYGKYFKHHWIFGYELYLTNGFDDRIISNPENRTSLAAGKSGLEKFEESNSGIPMFTGKISVRNRNIGEIGISYMSGVYNKFREDGLTLDNKRSLSVLAIDFSTLIAADQLNITGEIAMINVNVPETYSQNYGSRQFGGFIDFTGTILQRPMFGWDKAKLNIGVRLEYADYNQGTFRETGDPIADHLWAIVPAIAFRPVGATVIRFNYRHQVQTDLLSNPPAKTGVIQFGLSTYF